MKRYWVKLTIEVREYDEARERILPQGIRFEPATNLTPEPAKFIRETLAEHAARVAEVAELAAPSPDTNGGDGQRGSAA